VGRETKPEDQWPTTCPAGPWRLRGGWWLLTCLVWAALPTMVVARAGLQKRPDLIARWAAVRAQDAIVSDRENALGTPVWEEAADARCGGTYPVLPRVAPAGLEPEGDRPVFPQFHAVVGDGHAAEVRGAVSDARGAGADRLTRRSPGVVPDVGGHLCEPAGLGQGCLARATEELGARADRDQPGMRAGRAPWGALRRQGAPGHEIMDMRRIGQIPRPGVQDPTPAERSAEDLWVQGQGFQRGRGGLAAQGIHEVWVRAGHRPQCRGQDQGDQNIGDRQEPLAWLFPPWGRLGLVARGTRPISAGMIAGRRCTARHALLDRPAEGCRTTGCNSRHGLSGALGAAVLACGAILRSIAPEDVRQLEHG
jgi:hypothetical protein